MLLAETPSAPGSIATIEEGQPAPFSGTLFSVDAAAKLLLDLQYNKESCKIDIEREKGILGAKLQLDIDKLNSTLEIERDLFKQRLEIKNSQIDFFIDNYTPDPWYKSGEFLICIRGYWGYWGYGSCWLCYRSSEIGETID